MYIGSWDDSDTITFYILTKGVNGAVIDADAVPAYRIYEDETATPIHVGSMAKLDDSNTIGLYSERLQVLMTKGKSYTIHISYAISSVAYAEIQTIQMSAAADLRHIEGNATDGYNATLSLKSLMVVNDAGDAVYIQSQGNLGRGLYVAGNGGSAGAEIVGGIGGDGMIIKSGGENGFGLKVLGTGYGYGARILGGTQASYGLCCEAGVGSNGDGAAFYGDGNGNGMRISNINASGVSLLLQDLAGSINFKETFTAEQLQIGSIYSTTTSALSELSAGKPSDTPTLSQLLMFLYMQQKNKITTTLTLQKLYAANGTTEICKNALDDNGTTFTRSPSVAP
jgi:hypothetical protein